MKLSEAKIGDLVRFLPRGNPDKYTTGKLVEISELDGEMEYWFITDSSLTNNKNAKYEKKTWNYKPRKVAMFTYEIYTEELHPEYFL